MCLFPRYLIQILFLAFLLHFGCVSNVDATEFASKQTQFSAFDGSPLWFGAVLIGFSLLPFLALSVTSFLKLSIVFAILRNALGAGQIPSQALGALLAFVLSAFIMAPTGQKMFAAITESKSPKVGSTVEDLLQLGSTTIPPLEQFLKSNTREREREFFRSLRGEQEEESLLTLIPAFVISEVHQAFAIGFIIFLPFLVVDLVVANVLIGLGMMMVSPVSISLPFKLVLFVLCDGWFLLTQSLIRSYVVE